MSTSKSRKIKSHSGEQISESTNITSHHKHRQYFVYESDRRQTALFYAVFNDSEDATKVLLNAGAETDLDYVKVMSIGYVINPRRI